jgi:hypothetical protein
MNSNAFSWMTRTLILVFAVGIGAVAQNPVHFSGIINDFTPAHDAKGNPTGPWELHGEWNLNLNGDSGTAGFSAVMTMENSDYWLSINPNPPADPDVPATRNPHAHHITMVGAAVTFDTSVCPANKPATTTGFVVTGMASIAGNGSPAPFQSGGVLSPLQVCVTGGTVLQSSNITLVFSAPASGHFGSQAIRGAVRTTK